MRITLKKLSTVDGMDVHNMLQEIPKEENGFQNGGHGLSYDSYKQWLIRSDQIAKGIDLEDWMVPQNTYWLYVDEKPVGMGKLRLRLTEKLEKDGGNCGYGIVPVYRGCGYGKILLRLLIEEARTLNIGRILLTIEKDNPASLKVALSNGGMIEKSTDELHYVGIKCNAH